MKEFQNAKQYLDLPKTEELQKKITYAKQNHFGDANKPGKMLAYQIRKEKSAQYQK